MIYIIRERPSDCIKIADICKFRVSNRSVIHYYRKENDKLKKKTLNMTTKIDYKKKLMEYRKSIGVTTKTVAFKDYTPQPAEDLPQEQKPQVQQKDSTEENVKLAPQESVNFKLSSPPPPSATQQQDQQSSGPSTSVNSILFDPIGCYNNWNSHHALLVSQPWCCVGDLMAFCEKYEFKAISVSDVQTHANIVSEVRALLGGKAPFDKRKRFPGNIRNPENLYVCIGRCPSVEYHLERILNAFRRPLNKLSTDKQNMAKQNFHLAIRELHLDVSARVTEVRLYDRMIFEKDFHLKWQDTME